jgi:hypothetical protein
MWPLPCTYPHSQVNGILEDKILRQWPEGAIRTAPIQTRTDRFVIMRKRLIRTIKFGSNEGMTCLESFLNSSTPIHMCCFPWLRLFFAEKSWYISSQTDPYPTAVQHSFHARISILSRKRRSRCSCSHLFSVSNRCSCAFM